MSRFNRKLILRNISEAREELERIAALVGGGGELSEGKLSVMFEHAYHHLNFAWNARRVPMKRYEHLSHAEFNEWGRYPADLELLTIREDG